MQFRDRIGLHVYCNMQTAEVWRPCRPRRISNMNADLIAPHQRIARISCVITVPIPRRASSVPRSDNEIPANQRRLTAAVRDSIEHSRSFHVSVNAAAK